MGADVADLDRFASDSEDAPVPAAAPPSAGASPSSPADAKGGGTSKAARLRAKKAAARAAQKARRREEKARFPPKRVDERISSDGEDEDDENSGSDEKDEKDEKGEKLERVVATRRAMRSDADRSADKTHHGVLNVEGVVVDGKLVLVDRESKHVYSSTRRAHDGTHLRVGVWDPETGTVRRLPRRDVDAQRAPPRNSNEKTPNANENDDDDDDTLGSARMEAPPSEITHAFEVDPDDHCETSPEAHGNVVNFLAKIAERVGKRPSDLVIYDPYYCAGGTKRSFATLGFKNVINPNEDFYDVLARDAVPTHDVLITNPPYSANHVERCLTFAAENLEKHARPYFLLLPSYVVNKPYYVDALLTGGARGRAWRERNDAKAEKAEKAEKVERAIPNILEKSDSGSETTSDSDSDSDSEIASDDAADAADADAMKIHSPTPKTSRGTSQIRDVRSGSPRAGSSSSRKQTLPFYVAPSKRYYYWTPKSLASSRRRGRGGDDASSSAAERKKRKRGHVGRLGERTSPFPSFWYCGLGEGFQTAALRWHRKLPRAMVDGYTVASHPNDLPLHVLDEWDPRREKLMAAARDGESSWRNGGMNGRARKPPPRRFAGFSGANCGQNMPAKDKKRYAEFSADAPRTRDREGAMFARPRRKNKY